jgi:hypothetical protein
MKMKLPTEMAESSLRKEAAEVLSRARKLPSGPYKNDLRQLGWNLLRMHKLGIRGNVKIIERTMH